MCPSWPQGMRDMWRRATSPESTSHFPGTWLTTCRHAGTDNSVVEYGFEMTVMQQWLTHPAAGAPWWLYKPRALHFKPHQPGESWLLELAAQASDTHRPVHTFCVAVEVPGQWGQHGEQDQAPGLPGCGGGRENRTRPCVEGLLEKVLSCSTSHPA